MKSKLLALVMTGLLVLGMLSGCGSTNKTFGESAEEAAQTGKETAENNNAADGDEMYHAVLVYVVAQDSQDQEKVNARFNELTKEQLNMEVTLMPMTFSTWGHGGASFH